MKEHGPQLFEHKISDSTELEAASDMVKWEGGANQPPHQQATPTSPTTAIWNPSRIVRVVESFPTGSSVVRVETEQGEGFLKALSNKTEPHNLAAELVGTLLARWMKLPTLDFHIITLTADDRIQLADGTHAHPGPAFITRFEDGFPWSGDRGELDSLLNPDDVGRLIVLDTWTLNCDRFSPQDIGRPRKNRDNVYLSRRNSPQGQFVLTAIDHGCCFTCGRELTPRLSDLGLVKLDQLYGLFPQFRGRIDRGGMLKIVLEVEAITRQEVENFVRQVPSEWCLSPDVREALCEFLCRRAKYLYEIIDREWPPQNLFDAGVDRETQQ